MNTYYVAGFPYSDSLAHYGVKGQKWGVRRYQNPDGTLTAEGRKRYGEDFGTGNANSIARRIATGDHFLGSQRHRDKREDRLANKIEKNRSRGKSTEKAERKYNAQKQKNTDLANYVSNTQTSKLWAQNWLMTGPGADAYRSARARGSGRARSFIEATGIFGTPIGVVLRVSGDRKKYGALTHSL